MDDMMVWMVVLGVFVGLASVLWWALIIFGVFKLASAASRRFEAQLAANEQLVRQFATGQKGGLHTGLQAQLLQRLSQMNQNYSTLNGLERQRYDLRVSELQGMAAQAGIDWTPPS